MSALDPLLEAHFRYRYGGAKQRDKRSTTCKCTSEAEKEGRWLQRLYLNIALNRQKSGKTPNCKVNYMKVLVISLVALTNSLMFSSAITAELALQPWKENPWYWSYCGEPVLLLGGSDDDNLFQWRQEDLINQLDRLAAAGGNVIRNTMSDRKDRGFEIYPFQQLDNGLYDLNTWDPQYWQRFESLLAQTAKRHIFIQLEIWDRFDYFDAASKACLSCNSTEHWKTHPYNPANNINYSYEESGFTAHYPEHPGANKQPFFFTTPKQHNNQVVLPYQQRFVKKLLGHTLKYDHVLYCMDNETNGAEEWGRFWATFVRDRAAQEGKVLYLTEMWDDWNLTGSSHKRTFDHPELYGFVDVSQNNHNKGQQHWDNFSYVREYLAPHPRPMNTTKTYGASGNKFGDTDQDGIERFWRHLLAGAASMRFHRPDSGLGLNNKAVACIRAARLLESLVPLWSIVPANALLSDRHDNEAYVAAHLGQAYIVYFPSGGEVVLDLSAITESHIIHWINIDTGQCPTLNQSAQQHNVTNAQHALSSPSDENWVAVILATP